MRKTSIDIQRNVLPVLGENKEKKQNCKNVKNDNIEQNLWLKNGKGSAFEVLISGSKYSFINSEKDTSSLRYFLEKSVPLHTILEVV